jgi:hypothetical protein
MTHVDTKIVSSIMTHVDTKIVSSIMTHVDTDNCSDSVILFCFSF